MEEIKNMGNIEEEEQYELADRWTRLAANIIDGLIMFIPLFIIALFLFLIAGEDSLTLDGSILYKFFAILIFASAYFGVNGYLLIKKGQTLGKKFMDIKIVTVDEKLPTIKESFILRYLSLALLGLIPYAHFITFIDILFIFRKDRRCLHDLLAGTKVVFVNE